MTDQKEYNQKKRAYNMQYNKDKLTQIKFNLHNEHDADILERLRTVQNKQGYIKGLIRDDIRREGKNDT